MKMRKCKLCGQTTENGIGCTGKLFVISQGKTGKPFERILCQEDFCPDCKVGKGQLHHFGCETEECPACHNKIMDCDCEVDSIHNTIKTMI